MRRKASVALITFAAQQCVVLTAEVALILEM